MNITRELLTERQVQVLKLIEAGVNTRPVIQREIGLSTTRVGQVLKRLRRLSVISVEPGKPDGCNGRPRDIYSVNPVEAWSTPKAAVASLIPYPKEVALGLAKEGRKVFPATRDKQPPRGFRWQHWATTDLTTIAKWFDDESLTVAMATGFGVVVIDQDCSDEDFASWVDGREWPRTRMTITQRGGRHFWFKLPDGMTVGNTSGSLARGIDVRGDGGYVIVAGRGQQGWWKATTEPLATAPVWLVEAVQKPEPLPVPQKPIESLTRDLSGYEAATLHGMAEDIQRAEIGTRNQTLNSVAFRAGGFVATGVLDESKARDVLRTAALNAGLAPWEVEATLDSGLTDGRKSPKTPKERTRVTTATTAPVEEAGSGSRLKKLADVEDLTGELWWGDRLAVGGLTILAAPGAVGKSHLTTSIAASLSVGEAMPGGAAIPPVKSCLVNFEDPDHEVKNRVLSYGGNPDLVHVLKFAADEIVEVFAELAAEGVRLVVIDPLAAFIPRGVDVNSDDSMRSAILSPLKEAAERHDMAVVIVHHTRKGRIDPDRPMDSIHGSVGIVNAARSVLMVIPSTDEGIQRLDHVKHNISAMAPTLLYGFDGENNRIAFKGITDVTIAEAASATDRGSKQEQCDTWLEVLLRESAMRVPTVYEMGRKLGFNQVMVDRSKNGLKVKPDNVSGKWYWELPVLD